MLPVDLVYRHILPHAFEHPREVLSLLLVCSHFAGGASRPWFWHPFVRRQKRGIVALVERDGRLDAEERAGLLACVARNWTPELLLGAFEELRDCIRALVNEHDFGLVQRIRTAGTRDRSCSVFVGYQDGNGSRNGPAVTFFASGNYFRGNYAMDTFLGPIEFWWKCGMYFQGYTLVNMRVGAGSIWFQDGHVFKCENWDGSREAMCQSQSGTWTLPDGKTTVDGTLSRGFAAWHAHRAETNVHPFFICSIGQMPNQMWYTSSEARGVLEACSKEDVVYMHGAGWFFSGLQPI